MIEEINSDINNIQKNFNLDKKESLMMLIVQELKELRYTLNEFSNKK